MLKNDSEEDKTQTHLVLSLGMMVAQYRIIKKIGAGGMGEVFLAEDTKLKREVALKFLPAQHASDSVLKARFRREAEATAKLNHPNIVTIYEVSDFAGRPFFAMELIKGKSLLKLSKTEELELPRIIELAVQICDGLEAAHDQQVVHRDIKPANIVIDSHGRPKILDFGLAAISGGEQLTKAGSTLGTTRYMSPEQIAGKGVDHRSDLFSLGILIYELITRTTPFERSSDVATLKAITEDKAEPLARFKTSVPESFQQLIDKLLEKDCELRYQDARGLKSDLKRIQLSSPDDDSSRPSIAVLPFANMSTDKEQEYFCDGIAEDILNDLAQIDKLRVVSRTSSFAFKGKTEDLRSVGLKLNAQNILEGSVRKAGNRVRITAQLIKVSDGYHLWSERYDRDLDDIFAIQDEISQSIVAALKIKLDPNHESEKPKVPTKNIEAYELYLRGRIFFHQSGRKGLKYSRDLFLRAIEKDTNYALAYAGLAESLADDYMFFGNDELKLQEALEASNKALDINPELAEAHTARGMVISIKKMFDEAEAEFKTAISLNKNLFEAYYHYARSCFVQGKHQQAVDQFTLASKVKPDDYQSLFLAATSLMQLNLGDKAKESLRRGLEIAKNHLELNPSDVRAVYLGAGALAELGEVKEAKEWAARANAMEPNEAAVKYNCACLYAKLNEVETSVKLLGEAIACGFSAKIWIENDSDLNCIREHPDYLRIIASFND